MISPRVKGVLFAVSAVALVGAAFVPLALMAASRPDCAIVSLPDEAKFTNPAPVPASVPQAMPAKVNIEGATLVTESCPCTGKQDCKCAPGNCSCPNCQTKPVPPKRALGSSLEAVNQAVRRTYSSSPEDDPYYQVCCQSMSQGRPLVLWIDTPRDDSLVPPDAIHLEVKTMQGEEPGYVVMRPRVHAEFATERHPRQAPVSPPPSDPTPYPVLMQHLPILQQNSGACRSGRCGH